jgi:hypothetical protein
MNKKIIIAISVLSMMMLSSCTSIACFFLEEPSCPVNEFQQCLKNTANDLCISYGLNISSSFILDRYSFYCSGFTREHGYNNQQFAFTHEEANRCEEVSK